MRQIFAEYIRICSHWRGASIGVLVLRTASGLSEGLALLVLVPILSALMGEAATPAWARTLAWLELGREGGLVFGFAVFSVLGLGAAGLRLWADMSTLRLKTRVERTLRSETTRYLLGMDWVRFLSLRLGNVTDAVVIDGQQVSYGVQAFLSGAGAICVVLMLGAVALVVSLPTTVYTAAFGLLGILVFRLGQRASERHVRTMRDTLSLTGAQVADIFGNLKFLRAAGQSAKASRTANGIFATYAEAYRRCYGIGNQVRFVVECCGILFISALLYVNLTLLDKGLAETLVFLTVFSRIVPRLLMAQEHLYLSHTYLTWHHQHAARKALAETHPALEGGRLAPSFERGLRLRDVGYTYPGGGGAVLSGLDLDLSRGRCVAVVGPSGSGKSTLIDLVCALLTPSHGCIEVDGHPLAELNLEAWRSRIGLVLQDNPAFHATVLENIAWGDEAPDRERAQAAARRADAWEFITALPGGLDAVIGEKGGRLSGGQRQRLALARALYRDPWLLLLDEATSALDGASEAEVQSALAAVKGSCTILLVAHRLTTVQMADHIVVLQDGRIAEQGSWDELMAREAGLFRAMAAMQGLA